MPSVADLTFYVEAAIAVILVFAVCITLHEFGHFYVAKKSGVAVPVFSIGFGPKLIKFRRNGTEYSLRLLPFGGFVQMAGETPQETWFPVGHDVAYELNDDLQITTLGDPKDLVRGYVGTVRRADLTDKMEMAIDTAEGVRTFQVMPHAKVMLNARSSIPLVARHEQVLGKPLWQRASIILAGPVMNLLLAGFLFSAVNTHMGVPTTVIGSVEPGTPAAVAGLRQGDKILQVDNQTIRSWEQLVTTVQTQGHSGNIARPIHLIVERQGQGQDLTITPEMKQGVPLLGIDSSLSHNLLVTVPAGFAALGRDIALTFHGYVGLIAHHQFQSLSGPVGIAEVVSQQVRVGFWHVVMVAGALSLGLGLFNLLPIPALDGGRLLFMVIELLRGGRRIDPEKEGLVHFVGFAVVMLFAVVITYRDVTKLF